MSRNQRATEPTPALETGEVVEASVDMVDVTSSKVGDTIDLANRAAGYVRLPDGTVVTCRGSYTARHEGEHVFFAMVDDQLAEVDRRTVVKAS